MASLGKLIGNGRTADVLMWGEDKVVKLFHEGFSKESIDCYRLDYNSKR